MSWLIVLLGAEISYAIQNVGRYEFEPDTSQASPGLRKLVALRVTLFLVRRFGRGATPVAGEEIADELKLPLPLTHRVLHLLRATEALRVVRESEDRLARVPRAARIGSTSPMMSAMVTSGVASFST